MKTPILLIAGLGNPAPPYEKTWHNVGFVVIEKYRLAHQTDFPSFSKKEKLQSYITIGKYRDKKIILVKPNTFMNQSGDAIGAMCRFYKIYTKDIWIIHDDIDLILGEMRISTNATSAGHRGVESIIQNLQSKEMTRFRIGIRTQRYKQHKISAQEYVLQKVKKPERVILEKILNAAVQAIDTSLKKGVHQAMNEYNGLLIQ